MLLSVYEDAFEAALKQNDLSEAIFQIHLMCQADPFDQQRIIRLALERYLEHAAVQEDSGEQLEELQARLNHLEDRGSEVSTEQWEQVLGEVLYSMEEHPSESLLEMLVDIAETLESRGALSKREYPSQQTAKPLEQDVSRSSRQPTRRRVVKGRAPKSKRSFTQRIKDKFTPRGRR